MLETIMHYLFSLGLSGLLAGVVIEALGIPFPGGIMVVLAGFMISEGRMNFLSALITLLAGYTSGSVAAYFAGKYFGEQFLHLTQRYLHIPLEKIIQTRNWLEHSAPMFIIFGRFLPGLSNLTPYMAGISRVSVWYFLLYNTIFAVCWGVLYLMIGVFFGHNYRTIVEYFNNRLLLMGLAVLGIYLIYPLVIKRFVKSKR